jgi:hypothetical protein
MRGTVNFGSGNLTSAGLDDIWVAKFDTDGTHMWSKRFGDSSVQYAWSVTTNADGDVYLFGDFAGTIDFGGGPLTATGGYDVYVVKLRGSNGNHEWSMVFPGSDTDWAKSVVVDEPGYVYLTGFFNDTIDFSGGTLTSAGSSDIYIAKLTPMGFHAWSKRFGDSQLQTGLEIATDAAGDVFAAGDFYGTVNFGGGNLTSGGSHDFYVAKFDTDGNHRWSKRFGGAGEHRLGGLDVHPEGLIFIGGHFENTLDFGGGGVLNSYHAHDGFLAGLDPSGNHIWSKRFGNGQNQYINGVAMDPSAAVATVGAYNDSMYFHVRRFVATGNAISIGLAKFGEPPVGTCPGALHDLTPDAPLYGSYSSYEERGVFVTSLQDFEVCAIGLVLDAVLPVGFSAQIYEAGGTTRGPLLAFGEFAAAGPGERYHYAPVNFVLEACKDYDIAVSYGQTWWQFFMFDEADFTLPYDVGGVIRVRDGELFGNPAETRFPRLSIIGSPLGDRGYVDLGPPETAWLLSSDGGERGIYVTAKKTFKLLGIKWDMEPVYPPATVVARIYEATGTTRGPLIASGAQVAEAGMGMHHIPITAVLVEGHDYDIVVEYPESWWNSVLESQITLPYDVEDLLTVRDGEYEGNPANSLLTHFAMEWTPYVSGSAYELGKHSETYPPPYTSTQSTHRGVYLTSLADQDIYSVGWRGDSQAGGTLIAWVFEASGISRGAMISEGTTYCDAEGMRWHDVPVAAEFLNNQDYVVEFSFASANEWGYWDDYTGMPYENYGLFRVYASCHGGSPNWHEIPELRVNACNAAGTAVEEKPDGRPPRFTLEAPRPNPATAMTAIPFSLDEAGPVTIEVYDVAGRRVAVLLSGELRPEGPGTVELNANKLAAGVYFVKMKNRIKSVSRKITIIH